MDSWEVGTLTFILTSDKDQKNFYFRLLLLMVPSCAFTLVDVSEYKTTSQVRIDNIDQQ